MSPRSFVAVSLLLVISAASAVPLAAQTIAFRDVTVVDVRATNAGEALRREVTVLVSGERIASVDAAEIPADAEVIDGSGKYLIPGLFDMHVHLAGQGDGAMTSMVVHGVTAARDMGGDLEQLDAALARAEAGTLVAPRVARAGFVLESRDWLDRVLQLYADGAGDADYMRRTRIGIATKDDVYEAVGRVVESGADLLKFRNTPPADVFRFLMGEAQLAGLRIAGHEPNSIDLLEAVSLGVGSLEHYPISAILQGTSEERWQAIFAAMIEHGVHATPTFAAMKNRRMSADELEAALAAERESPRWAALSPQQIAKWEESVPERRSESGELDWNELCDHGEAVVRAMHDAGVPFLAGTDLGVTFVYPGSSLHEELVALVENAGLSPLEALQAATVNAASWLGWDHLGSIGAGHLADLVLLEANPLEDIANVARIHTVVSRGVVHGPQERERLMAEVHAAAAR